MLGGVGSFGGLLAWWGLADSVGGFVVVCFVIFCVGCLFVVWCFQFGVWVLVVYVELSLDFWSGGFGLVGVALCSVCVVLGIPDYFVFVWGWYNMVLASDSGIPALNWSVGGFCRFLWGWVFGCVEIDCGFGFGVWV